MLAAGGGRRLGVPKALLRLAEPGSRPEAPVADGNGAGRLLVERAVQTAREGGCDPIVVVLGAAAAQVQQEANLDGTTIVVNKAWGSGMGSSLKTGLAALEQTDAQAALVLLVDMPGITAMAIQRVVALPYPDALVCATYGGRRGHPMLLGRNHWPGIITLATADVGARPYLLAHRAEIQEVSCADIADDTDIDTPEEAARWGIVLPAGASQPTAGQQAEADRSLGTSSNVISLPLRPSVPKPRS